MNIEGMTIKEIIFQNRERCLECGFVDGGKLETIRTLVEAGQKVSPDLIERFCEGGRKMVQECLVEGQYD